MIEKLELCTNKTAFKYQHNCKRADTENSRRCLSSLIKNVKSACHGPTRHWKSIAVNEALMTTKGSAHTTLSEKASYIAPSVLFACGPVAYLSDSSV